MKFWVIGHIELGLVCWVSQSISQSGLNIDSGAPGLLLATVTTVLFTLKIWENHPYCYFQYNKWQKRCQSDTRCLHQNKAFKKISVQNLLQSVENSYWMGHSRTSPLSTLTFPSRLPLGTVLRALSIVLGLKYCSNSPSFKVLGFEHTQKGLEFWAQSALCAKINP